MDKSFLVYIISFYFLFVDINEAGQGNTRKRKNKQTTMSCGSAGTRCTCEDRAYEVILGRDEDGQDDLYTGPFLKDGTDDVYCYHYIVARTEDATDTCTDETLDSLIIGVNPQQCGDITCSQFRNMVHSAGCECDAGSNCCEYEYEQDDSMSIQGIKFTFSTPIESEDADEMIFYICTNGIYGVDYNGGFVAYYSVGTYAYACDNYDVPAFCNGLLYVTFIHFYTSLLICIYVIMYMKENLVMFQTTWWFKLRQVIFDNNLMCSAIKDIAFHINFVVFPKLSMIYKLYIFSDRHKL